MINFILDKFKKWRRETEVSVQDDAAPAQEQAVQTDQEELLEDPSTVVVWRLREDGEFTVALDFIRTEDDVAIISGTMLHMINSGFMAEYFIEALDLWAEEKQQKKFVLKVVNQWRSLYDKEEEENKKDPTQSKLAVDPSDVFGLRRLQELK